MKENEIDKIITEHKTNCCNVEWYKEKRFVYRCSECKKDITMEIMYLTDALMKDLNK